MRRIGEDRQHLRHVRAVGPVFRAGGDDGGRVVDLGGLGQADDDVLELNGPHVVHEVHEAGLVIDEGEDAVVGRPALVLAALRPRREILRTRCAGLRVALKIPSSGDERASENDGSHECESDSGPVPVHMLLRCECACRDACRSRAGLDARQARKVPGAPGNAGHAAATCRQGAVQTDANSAHAATGR